MYLVSDLSSNHTQVVIDRKNSLLYWSDQSTNISKCHLNDGNRVEKIKTIRNFIGLFFVDENGLLMTYVDGQIVLLFNDGKIALRLPETSGFTHISFDHEEQVWWRENTFNYNGLESGVSSFYKSKTVDDNFVNDYPSLCKPWNFNCRTSRGLMFYVDDVGCLTCHNLRDNTRTYLDDKLSTYSLLEFDDDNKSIYLWDYRRRQVTKLNLQTGLNKKSVQIKVLPAQLDGLISSYLIEKSVYDLRATPLSESITLSGKARRDFCPSNFLIDFKTQVAMFIMVDKIYGLSLSELENYLVPTQCKML